jgi:hypothetical protein
MRSDGGGMAQAMPGWFGCAGSGRAVGLELRGEGGVEMLGQGD